MSIGPDLSSATSPAQPPAPALPCREPSRAEVLLAVLTLGYCVLIVLLCAWMWGFGDRQWLATMLLFGPRWLCALPWPLLVAAAAVWRRRLLWPLAATGLVILFPLLGFRWHWSSGGREAPALRVLTCNVHGDARVAEAVARLVEREQPDIVALQETNRVVLALPEPWTVLRFDEHLIASRWPIARRDGVGRPAVPGKMSTVRFTVDSPHGEIHLFSVHLFTPRPGLEAVLSDRQDPRGTDFETLDFISEYRAAESQRVSQWIASFTGPKIVLGDFNTPIESTIYRENWSSLCNAFSQAGRGFGYTKQSRALGIDYGTRIDHVLSSEQWRARRAWLGPDIGSDHLPLLAEFEVESVSLGGNY